MFLSRVHHRLIRDGLAEILDEHAADSSLSREIQRLDTVIEQITRKDSLTA